MSKSKYSGSGKLLVQASNGNDDDLPEWEKELDRKHGHVIRTVLSVIDAHGLDVHTWLTAYLAACEANGGQSPPDFERFLPWNMTPDELRRYKQPTPVQVGDKVFPSSAACSEWMKEQMRLEDECATKVRR